MVPQTSNPRENHQLNRTGSSKSYRDCGGKLWMGTPNQINSIRKKINRETQLLCSLPEQARAYTAALILEKHVHLKLEKLETVHQKTYGLLLTISHMPEHLSTAH